MTGEHVREVLCLRSWQNSGIVTLGNALFEQAIRQADGAPVADELYRNTYESDDDVLYNEHE